MSTAKSHAIAIDLPRQPALDLPAKLLVDPSQETLKSLALEHTPCCFKTAHGSINKIARNKARMAKFTYVIDRKQEPDTYSHKTISPEKAQALIAAQRQYIEGKGEIIVINGYVGLGSAAIPTQWCYTVEGANIAGMQQILSFPRQEVESQADLAKEFQPAMRLVYTPNFIPDIEGKQAIIVDLDNYRTYIMGADYFGESKKGALRMSCCLIYRNGGLLMHSGAKEVTVGSRRLSMGILGLSGTGKTTTTFSKQGEITKPIQDDMVGIWPGGKLSVTENGCFAKTFGLTEESEPVIYRGTVDPRAWLENVYVDGNNEPIFDKGILSAQDVARLKDILIATGAPAQNVQDFIDGKVKSEDVVENNIPKDGWDFVVWSENGRSIIPMSAVDGAADLHDLATLESLGILNRDEGSDAATPALIRFSSPEQAAGYMMLGETSKTSAAGKDRGKTRSPFTQPFFPLSHRLQATRFSELAATFRETPMWLMNTGYVAGDGHSVERGEGYKVKIRHSSAILEALLSGEVAWTKDPDFGYDVVDVDHPQNKDLLEKVPAELLQPRRVFEAKGQNETYQNWVNHLHEERTKFLRSYDVDPKIVNAVVPKIG